MNLGRFGVFALALALSAACAARADDQKPLRHLVYHFDVTLTSSVSQENYSGTSNASGSNGDRGTITADVLAVQPDTGLVVRISEQARETRSAEPAMCVTYGNGEFVCEAGKKINEEEYTLLRLLGKNFVNRATIDAHDNWTYGTNSPDMDETSTYHIDRDNGGMLNITLSRNLRVKGAQGYTATTDGKITYNEKLEVPVTDTEDTLTRQEGAQMYNRLEQQISLSLLSDSMAGQTTASH